MIFLSKMLLFQFALIIGLLLNVGSAHALKRQGTKEIQTELTQWLQENDTDPSLSPEEKDQRREFIFKLRLKTHDKDSVQNQASLMRDFKKSSSRWENILGELLGTDLERGESLISFLKDYVSYIPIHEDIDDNLQEFKDSRLYFDGKKMKAARPQDFEEAGTSAEVFLKQKEDLTLPEWYRLDLSAPLKPHGPPSPPETTPEASKTL